MTKIELEVALYSAQNEIKALNKQLRKLCKRVFDLEYPQKGIKIPEPPKLRIVNRK